MKKLLLIINPRAGKMTMRSSLFDIIQIFCENNWLVTTQITSGRGDATVMAMEAETEKGYNLIVCCGGDGTLNEVVNGIVQGGGTLPVGYIPAGSTNDFADSMGISTDLIQAAYSITKCRSPIKLDLGLFNNSRVFTYIASFGAFTATSYTVPQNMKNAMGHFAYVLGGIMDVTTIKPYHVSAQANGETYEGDYIFGAVSNSSSVGGIIKLGNEAVSLNDGKFEVLLVKNPSTPTELHKVFWGLFNADFSDSKAFDFFRTDKIKFDMPDGMDWSLDGEYEPWKNVVEIENIHSGIKLWYKPKK
ncbi:MAG: diacylglycerol kinase family lipid kinase [Bacillota bacterium]|nr:diacylglycerol kinase family lipid kinase [Bacillota bacterium]